MKEEPGGRAVNLYVYLITVQVSNLGQLTDKEGLRQFVQCLVEKIGMNTLGKMRIDHLAVADPLPNFDNVKAYSVNQPLKTSILSIDTWPEFLFFTLLINSCQPYSHRIVDSVARKFFKGAKITARSKLVHGS